MKAALDATPLAVAAGGIGRYTRELRRALAATYPDDEFALLKQRGWSRWWSAGLPWTLARRGFDVFHGTDFAVPYLPVCASVMTLHDLSPWKGYPATDRVRRRTPWLIRLRLATMIITPTEAVRREAIEMFRLPPAIVATVPEAAGAEFRPPAETGRTAPYFLMVGAAGPRKNAEVALAAFRQLRQESDSVELWLAGHTDAGAAEPGVRPLGAVADEELPALYGNAAAVLVPSRYEGFGLPLVEAMRCGAPVIASDDLALVEVGGGAALHAGVDDGHAWLAAMRTVLSPHSAELREAGLRRAADFSWERTARLTYDVYREALARHG